MISCEEAQLLMVPIWAGTLGIADEEKQSFESHLTVCQACVKEYEETKRLMSFVKKHWGPVSTETRQLLEHAGYKVVEQNHVSTRRKRPMTVEEGWKDLCRRCPDLAESTEKPKSLQLFLRIGAVAACLVIGVLSWMVFSNYSKPQVLPQDSSSRQVASVPRPFVKVELVRASGNIAVATDQKIVADNELKTLLINDKHQMVMNVGTSLFIEPLLANAQLGCLVKLSAGQIYTHVQHDGNLFVVDSAYGKAVITGTTFGIKATDTGTMLVVSEGAVQFESENGVVNVTAGQKSEVFGQAAPSNPISCNVAELTAWATGYKAKPELVEDKSRSDIVKLLSLWPNEKEPPGLEEVDYDYWIKEKRNWFRLQFPQLFQLQHALAQEGIEVDYPELLIKSGDVWQFVSIRSRPYRFSVLSFDSLLKTASDYGFDKQWLLENVTAANYALEKPALLKNSLTALIAFGQWNSSLEDAQKSSDKVDYDDLYSLFHASVYLTETRSLIWFAVRDGQYHLTDKERTEVLALLQKQVNAASICQENALHQPHKKEQLCDPVVCKEDKWYKWADVITKNIKTITSVEEKIAEYEIGE
ncbi:MAG: FecR domain-containing protein [Planctomycetota bacterium]